MDLIIADATGHELKAIEDYELDLAYGSGENDFELISSTPLGGGYFIFVDGQEYGGIIDTIERDTATQEVTYKGRTWHGILATKIIAPDAGADYLTVSGDGESVLRDLISRIGLQGLFKAESSRQPPYTSVQSYRFERYVDAYTGLCDMAKDNGLKLCMAYHDKAVYLRLEPIQTYIDEVDSDLMTFTSTRTFAPVNHLICLGKGELKDRIVIHYYADEQGRVSETQSLFGVDEVVATYDYSSAEEDELRKEGRKKLEEAQTQGSISVTIPDGGSYDVGDVIVGKDLETNTEISARIVKKIMKAQDGEMNVSYECGDDTRQTSFSSIGGSTSTGGATYYAGEGLHLTGFTFSAEVTQSKLDAVESKAESARSAASNASALASGANNKAEAAQASADEALSRANASVKTISATSALAAERTEDSVVLSHNLSGVSAGTYGSTSTYQSPTFAGYVQLPSGLAVDAQGHVTSVKTSYVRMPAATATPSASGLMSSADKTKLDGVEPSANAYTLPAATTDTLGGVKVDGTTIVVDESGVASAVVGGTSSFLAAYPVGALFQTTNKYTNPATYGGTWKKVPSMGAFTWERTA